MKMDLNLIRTFIVLYETRSVTKTAEQLFITQPSASYALSRLRDLFRDPLFVRTKSSMEPTSTADQLYHQLSPSLNTIQNTIKNTREFDASTSNKRFRIAMTDLGEMLLLPKIFAQMQQQAPNVELDIISLEIDKVHDWLGTGKVDAVVCSRSLRDNNIEGQALFKERYVCLINAQANTHISTLSMDDFLDFKHVLVKPSLGHGITEEVLSKMGVTRKISLELSHFSILPSVLQQTNVLAIVPLQIGEVFTKTYPLKVMELPFQIADFEVSLFWPRRHTKTPSNQWLRDIVLDTLATPM